MKKTTFILALLLLFIGWQANSQITTYPYSEDFEAGDGGWVADNTNNGTWALGLPAAVVINSAASGANSWVTNLTGNYNANDDSFVTSPVFDLSSLTAPTVSFNIWYEAEFSWDGAVFQSSIDGGTSWQNVGALGDPNWYNDGTINGSPGGQQEGWTGRNGTGSNGWINVNHALNGLVGQTNVIFRFAFASDGSGQDDGFAFDDVSIFNTDCPNPSAITAAGITSTSVDLSWTLGGTEAAWEVVVQPAGTGAPTGAGSPATDNTLYTDNTLTPATDYEVYVRANCGADLSVWTGPITFTTDCAIFTPTYLQDFTTIPANCWEVANNGDSTTGPTDLGTSSWTNDGYLNNGTTGAYKINLWLAEKSDWLLSPEIDLTGVPYQVEFDFGVMTFGSTTTAGTLGSDDTVELMITTDNGTTWTVLETFDATSVIPATGLHVVQNLTAYSGTTAQFGIRASEGTVDDPTDNDVFVDNFQVRAVPSCPDPLAVTATATGDTTADITWDAGSTETEWQIWIQPAGTGEPTTDGVVTSLNAPYPATGLTPSTPYEVYVRANCGTDGYSVWIGPVNFTTLNTPPPAPVGVSCASGASSTIIFTEDFGNDTNYVPSGWTGTTFADINGDWDITTVNGNSGGTGPNITWDGNAGTHLEYEGSGNTTNVASAITPAIDLSTAVDGAELSFWMHAFGDNMGTLNIGVSTSQTGPFTSEYTWIGDYQSTADEAWVPIGINLDAYLGQIIYIEISYVGTGDTFESDMAIDQVRVETCGDFCVAPTGITVDAITDTTADVSWTANNGETNWEIVVQPAGTGVPTGSGTPITTNPYTLTGLTASTVNEVYILSDCGNGLSVWAGPINFTTLNTPPPAPVGVTCTSGASTFIFTEDFGNDTNYVPAGWTGTAFTDTNGDWDITTVNANSTGTGPNITWDGNAGTHLEYEGSGNTTNVASAITPAIDLSTAVDGAELSFWMHAFGDNMGTLNIGVSTSQTGPFTTEYTWIGDYQSTADEAWVPIGVNLDAYLGQIVYIEISYVGTGDTWESDMAIDQVRVEACGTFCVAPSNITATSITETSADISWIPNGSETEWNYVIQPAGTGIPTSGTLVTTTTISETGLNPATNYEIYVQSVCGADTSTWAGPFTFSTLLQFNFTLDCATDGPQTIDYCYDNNDTNVFTFTSTDGTPLNLTINAGQVENSWDEVIVLDSDGVTNLNAATPYGVGGQIGGLTFQSSGDTISFAVESDGSGSCQSNSTYTSINLTVTCATCVNPTATFVVVDDCANGDQFLVDVDITSLGDATTLSIEDNQGNPPVVVSTTGIEQFGPYPFNTDIVFTVSNTSDINCVITSSAISLAACPPVNDNPCNATVALVNNGEACIDVNSGTLIEATDSGLPGGTCTTSADDDVWYQFTALGDQQIIQILNVTGGFNVDHALYELGTDCNDLTQLYCTTDDASITPTLTVGNVYYIRVFSAGTTATTINFDLCIQTLGVPTYCTEALPICADPTIFYPSIVGDQVAPPYIDYDCLGSQPDPQWNTIQFDDAGDYVFQLAQTNAAGTGLDIDFIVWGPFPGQEAGCFDLLPGTIADCSFSATATETITLTGVPANSIYIILITNFSQQSGSYVFTQQSGPLDGTNCDVVCEVALDYDGILIEQGLSAPEGSSDDINLCGATSVTLTAETAYAVDSYDWYVNGIYQDGVNSPTIEATVSGQYLCIVGGGICDDFTSSLTANINFFDSATATTAPALEVCDDGSGNGVFDLESQTATILGTQDPADFVVTYYSALANAQAGIGALTSPHTATDGTTIYVRVEDVDSVGSDSGCASTNTNFNLMVSAAPEATQPMDLEVCDDGAGNDVFDLTQNEATILGTQTGVVVSYHNLEADAISGDNAIANPSAYTITGNQETIFVRVENVVATDCYKVTDFNIIFNATPETTFNLDIPYEVCPNATSPITITAQAENYTVGEVSIKWYNEGVEIAGQTGLSLNTVLTAGEYEIEVTFNDTGCSKSEFVTVVELENCTIPQGISPGVSPGLNDNFDLSSFDVQSLEIYNRNGTLVYSKTNYVNEWEGQSNAGDELPVGTYYYVMKYQGNKTKASWVYINR